MIAFNMALAYNVLMLLIGTKCCINHLYKGDFDDG